MYDRDAFDNIANAITTWEVAAQQLPLPDLTEIVADCQHDLAHDLNAFHDLYDSHPDHVSGRATQRSPRGHRPRKPSPRRSSPWASTSAPA